MNKASKKIAKILLLIAMIFSELMTPISVLAEEIIDNNAITPEKGDIRLNGKISSAGSVTVTEGTLTNGGDVQVTKTVSKTDTLGRYKVEFEIKGKDRQDLVEVTKPIYLVIVLDTSGSMICDSSNNSYAYATYEEAYRAGDRIGGNNDGGRKGHNNQGGNEEEHVEPASYTAADGTTIWCSNASANSSYILKDKWEKAVEGAVKFSQSLAKMDNTYISVVTFATNATTATDFEHAELEASDFGHPVGSTNLKGGLENAQTKLSSITDENAQKYIVVIGDGEPTAGATQGTTATQAAENVANNAKLAGTKIFAIGYGVDDNSTAEEVLKYISSDTVVTQNENGTITTEEQDLGYYKKASSDGISTTLKTVFEELGEPKKAGTNATLTDNVGSAFSIVDKEGQVYTSDVIKEITETGTKLSFYIDIDQDSPTGWYKTNEGFNLVYTDSNGNSQTITSTKDPEVYWEQNTYKYVVNYYKDEITEENKIASDERYAVNNTVIDITNVEKDKYLDTLEGYEFNSLTPENITVTNDGTVKEINVLYTIKKFSYIVNYYYDDVKEDSLTINKTNIPYNTTVDSKDYYLASDLVKEGYILDESKTDNEVFTIKDNTVIIDIYYKKNSYDYVVKYYFNNIFDNTFTKNNTALYGSTILASDNYLTQEQLNNANKEEFFIDPTNPSNTSQITIKTENNELNIYYINTTYKNEKVEKTTTNKEVTSSNTVVNYTVKYSIDISNIEKDSTITTTIIDTLPYEIDIDKSNLNGGLYDSNSKTITWTITEKVNEFIESKSITKEINYSVVYKDFANLSSQTDNNLINTVKGQTSIDNKVTNGVTDNEIIPVNIEGTLKVSYVDETGALLENPISITTRPVGTDYETIQKSFYGYTFNRVEGETIGKYIEGEIEVKYIYTKNPIKVTDDITKEGPTSVKSINDSFTYSLNYNAVVEEYVGNATLVLIDKLPFTVKEIKELDERCTFDKTTNTLTCRETYNIDENNKTIKDSFAVTVVYKNITSETVINEVISELTYGNETKKDTGDTTTIVEKGNLVVTYKTTDGVVLEGPYESTNIGGVAYTTEEKSFYGYTLTKVPENKEGVYVANSTVEVKYIYTKNPGEVTKNEVIKTGLDKVDSINDTFEYTLTYNGKIEKYLGKATLVLIDKLPFTVKEIKELDNRCVYNSETNTITCTEEYNITEKENEINDSFKVSVTYEDITSDVVTNEVKSELTYENNKVDETDKQETIVETGKLLVTYKTTDGVVLEGPYESTNIGGTEYTTEEKTFYGYTFKEVKGNTTGEYVANSTVTVEYIYTKNPGEVTEELNKEGLEIANGINSKFDYTISYNAIIEDYVGTANITIVDKLPYRIDIEKSDLSDGIYDSENNTITWNINDIEINEINKEINLEKTISLYYIDIDMEDVTNKVESTLVYGETTKNNEDEYTTVVKNGEVKIYYVIKVDNKYIPLNIYATDEEGNILPGFENIDLNDIILVDMIGTDFETIYKEIKGYIFDGIYVGNLVEDSSDLTKLDGTVVTGKYTEETQEYTYVYEMEPGLGSDIPPKTGVIAPNNNDLNYINYINYALLLLVGLILKKRI